MYRILFLITLLCMSCNGPSSDERQTEEQERILQEGTSAIGMPNIQNFRERRLLKDILELRDQADFATYTYQFSEMHGLVFLCRSIGYPIPYSTQYTNPARVAEGYEHHGVVLPQADPNGLFSPGSAEGSWVMCIGPNGGNAQIVYSESRLTTSPFELGSAMPPLTRQPAIAAPTPTP